MWPREGTTVTGNEQISDFAPNNALLSSVPEPATWLSMLLGFGLVGIAIRYRQPKSPGHPAEPASGPAEPPPPLTFFSRCLSGLGLPIQMSRAADSGGRRRDSPPDALPVVAGGEAVRAAPPMAVRAASTASSRTANLSHFSEPSAFLRVYAPRMLPIPVSNPEAARPKPPRSGRFFDS